MSSLESRFARFARCADARALSDVFDRTAPTLLRLAIHLCGDAVEAEDLVQATFVVAIEQASAYDPNRPLLPWLAGILANKARTAARARARAPDPSRLRRRPGPRPDEQAARQEMTERVQRALDRLEEPYRQVLVLHLRYGLEPAEIADALGRPPATVRTQLRRGKERLRRFLPAGLASGLLAGLAPERGLAAVKSAVLRKAPVRSMALLGGVVVKKKLAAAAVLLALLGGAGTLVVTIVDANRTHEQAAPPRATRTLPPVPLPDQEESAQAVPAPAPSPEYGRLLVRAVRAADGTPLRNVLITLNPYKPLAERRYVRADEVVDRLPPGPLRASAGPTSRKVSIVAGETAELELRLPRGYTLRGRVVDQRQRPVAGAEICMAPYNEFGFGVAVARADADGRFEIPEMRSPALLCARSPGHGASGCYYPSAKQGTTLDLTLVLDGAGGSIEGVVTTADGVPRPFAHVGARPRDYPARPPRSPEGVMIVSNPPVFLTLADQQGRFRLAGLNAGDVLVGAVALGLAPAERTVTVTPGATASVALRLDQGGSVAGTVASANREPIAETRVRLRTGVFGTVDTVTDASGAFRFVGVPAGKRRLSVHHKQHGEARRSVSVTLGNETWTEVTLAMGTVLRGRVLDADGRPLARCTLHLHGQSGMQTAWADAEGRFVFTNAGSGPFDLVVTPNNPGVFIPVRAFRRIEPREREIVFRLRPEDRRSAYIAGRMDGQADGLKVTVHHVGFARGHQLAVSSPFRIGPVVAGKYDVEVLVPGWAPVQLRGLALKPDETLDLGTLKPARHGTLRATLRVEGGKSWQRGVCFIVDGTAEQRLNVRNGVARSGPLGPGSYRLRVKLPPYAEVLLPFEITPGRETELEVSLRRGVWRIIRFEDTGDARELRVVIRDEQGTVVSDATVVPYEGRLTYAPILAPGRYVVTATTPDGQRGTWEVVQADLEHNATVTCSFEG